MVWTNVYPKYHPNKHKIKPPTQSTKLTKKHLGLLLTAHLQLGRLGGSGAGSEGGAVEEVEMYGVGKGIVI